MYQMNLFINDTKVETERRVRNKGDESEGDSTDDDDGGDESEDGATRVITHDG